MYFIMYVWVYEILLFFWEKIYGFYVRFFMIRYILCIDLYLEEYFLIDKFDIYMSVMK